MTCGASSARELASACRSWERGDGGVGVGMEFWGSFCSRAIGGRCSAGVGMDSCPAGLGCARGVGDWALRLGIIPRHCATSPGEVPWPSTL